MWSKIIGVANFGGEGRERERERERGRRGRREEEEEVRWFGGSVVRGAFFFSGQKAGGEKEKGWERVWRTA